MATIRPGHQPVLIVVDVQRGVVASAWERDRVVANVAQSVERARAAGVPVMWVQHHDEQLVQGSEAWQWVPELVPGDGEPAVHKSFNSAFEQTTLDALLAERGVTHVVLAGAASNWCIRATAYGALDRGYDLTLVADAHTTEDMDFGNGRVIAARDIVDELNVAMRWLMVPGRHNGVARAAELDFGRVPGTA